MPESKVRWLSDQVPTPEDRAAFALERQRERLMDEAQVALKGLSNPELFEIIMLAEQHEVEENNG